MEKKAVSEEAKTRMIVGLAKLFGGVLLLLTAYALWKADLWMLRALFELARWGLFAVLAWAGGTTVLKVVSRIRFDAEDNEKK